MGRMKCFWLLLGVLLFTVSSYDVSADVIPSENECRPYIEKAIHELKNPETTATDNKESTEDATTNEQDVSIENNAENSLEQTDDVKSQEDNADSTQEEQTENDSKEPADDDNKSQEQQNESQEVQSDDGDSKEKADDQSKEEQAGGDEDNSKEETGEVDNDSKEVTPEGDDTQEQNSAQVDGDSEQADASAEQEQEQPQNESNEENTATEEVDDSSKEQEKVDEKSNEVDDGKDSQEADATEEKEESVEEEKVRAKRSISDEATQEQDDSNQNESQENAEDANKSEENAEELNKSEEANKSEENAEESNKSEETANESQEANTAEDNTQSNETPSAENTDNASNEANEEASKEEVADVQSKEVDEPSAEAKDENSLEATDNNSQETAETSQEAEAQQDESSEAPVEESSEDEQQSEETMPEEDLTMEFEIPKNLRSRDHINALLGLDAESSIKENALKRTGDVVLKELKKIYDNSVKPLESMYKYRDLSNRHFGDPEIFSKPLILFMGPWSGGKSTILNYLTDNEYTPNSIRSGAEPSPAHFNILMHGDEPEVLDGTQLAADWTFSGLQKFGQGLMDRLRGQRLPSKLLERVNIVEIPGILEVRKHVSRYFPFNDACQWFIDRADIIFLVYDPSKLDVGPETEAILDQLKGREYQTRILLNKADQVKPEELLRVQGALIWNISPLMSSAQPPIMYTLSLWSHPFEAGAPVRLLQAQERAFLVDLREAIDKRIENKIASARRFAVRIRNHAKMVDCYLTTYYNQKGLFSNKKQIADKIIENPQNYNIYEGLSTLTNISRYDLPDPEVYLDFFRLNPLYNFKKLSETCTYFKGCPINKLDISIAYDLPELVGKYKNLLVDNLVQLRKEFDENCNQSEPEPPVKIITTR